MGLMVGEDIQGGVCENSWLCRGSMQMMHISLCYVRKRATWVERGELKPLDLGENEMFASVLL